MPVGVCSEAVRQEEVGLCSPFQSNARMLLIHPPVAKPCEPPPGIACLSGALDAHSISHGAFDANLEGLLHLFDHPPPSAVLERDTWTKRAWKNRFSHLASIWDPATYGSISRYTRAVRDLDRVLEKMGEPGPIRLGLANYQHRRLSPAKSADLLRAAEEPEKDLFHSFYRTRLEEWVERKNPELIGISLNFLTQAIPAFALMGFLRKRLPHTKLVLGGGLVTSWVRGTGRRNPFAGLVEDMIAGPGEAALLAALGEKGEARPSYLPDFDRLPTRRYLSPGFILPYSTTRGCYWSRCRFCPERAEGNVYSAIPAARVANDLAALGEKYRPALVHLTDNAVPPGVLERIVEKPFGIRWYGFARVTPHLADLDFCRGLRASGCAMLQLGIESGDPEVLDRLHKGIDLETTSKALKNLHRSGIAAYVYLLFGTPQETPAAARKTLEFTVRHSKEISFLNLALFNLPRRGEEAAGLQTEEFSEGDLSLYTGFTHPSGWNRGEVRQFLDREFKRHPAAAEILRRDPPVFTSNHAPFFAMNAEKKS